MTVTTDMQLRRSSSGIMSAMCLEDKFEVLKDIGDGSFGSVVLARVRTAGSHIARRGGVVSRKDSQADEGANVAVGRHQNDEENI